MGVMYICIYMFIYNVYIMYIYNNIIYVYLIYIYIYIYIYAYKSTDPMSGETLVLLDFV